MEGGNGSEDNEELDYYFGSNSEGSEASVLGD